MTLCPKEIKRQHDNSLRIEWSDGQTREYTYSELRKSCPCATCREKRNAGPPDPNQLPVLSAVEAQPLTVLGMKPVGNYAHAIAFSDGHDTGIFTFEHLREIGRSVDE